ncbi:MAG: hypothetical protein Q4B26_18945 [Eubacteriales bacterium]|nr:hypothetical protein [Eubacteriales bacterium]
MKKKQVMNLHIFDEENNGNNGNGGNSGMVKAAREEMPGTHLNRRSRSQRPEQREQHVLPLQIISARMA